MRETHPSSFGIAIPASSVLILFRVHRYTGEFRENKKNGKGKYEGANGTYEGEYAEGKKHGHGVFTWIDGSKYDGP